MSEKMLKLSCGNCGGDKFNLTADNAKFPSMIIARCMKCKSTTEIKLQSISMRLDWGVDSNGILCRLWEKPEPTDD